MAPLIPCFARSGARARIAIFAGVYDVAVTTITQDREKEALISRLSMQGVSYENALTLAQAVRRGGRMGEVMSGAYLGEAAIWIEVLSRHGDVGSRQRFTSTPITIGRAYDNDVVLDDPHVAAHHLRIVRSDAGVLTAEDLGSRNGLYLGRGRESAARSRSTAITSFRSARRCCAYAPHRSRCPKSSR